MRTKLSKYIILQGIEKYIPWPGTVSSMSYSIRHTKVLDWDLKLTYTFEENNLKRFPS